MGNRSPFLRQSPGRRRAREADAPGRSSLVDESGTWKRIVERYARRHRLSRQELRLLITSINGVPDKRVAHEWGCSRSTIGTYWKRIFAKTGMRPQRNVLADLLRFAAEPTLTPRLEK